MVHRHAATRCPKIWVALALVLLAMGAVALARVSSAFAGSGDFVGCTDVWLSAGAACTAPNEHTWVETEGWNTDANGRAVCTGWEADSTYVGNCDSVDDFGGYNAVYCTHLCNGAVGNGWVSNATPLVGDYFTGWGDYSS